MKINNIFYGFLFLFVGTMSQAQVTSGNVKVYKPEDNKHLKKSQGYLWTAKTDFVAMLVGEYPVIFEYRFANKWSVEGSAAYTYATWRNDGKLTSDYNSNDLRTKPASSYAFRGAVKYYPSSDYDAIEGWSFGLQGFIKSMKRNYEDSYVQEQDIKVKTGVSLQIAYQAFSDANISYEWILAVGFANVKRDYVELDSNDNPVKLSTNDSGPNVQFGIRLGFGD